MITQMYKVHPAANLFPLMTEVEFDGLKQSIKDNGQRESITIWCDQLIDGRNRLKACEELGIEPEYCELDESDDPLQYVLDHNLHRRHLTPSQAAMCAAKAKEIYSAQAKERQVRKAKSVVENLPPQNNGKSRDVVALAFGISGKSVDFATRVIKQGIPELIAAVDAGEIAVSAAATIAAEPEEQQREKVKNVHVANNSGENEWYTPSSYLDAARDVLGVIDLDPASSLTANALVQANVFYTKEQDGLLQEWPVGNVWMNPPYAQPLISKFCDRLVTEVERGSEAIVLVNNATETEWFQKMAAKCSAVCMPKTRIKFLDVKGDPKGAPLQGQCFLYFGDAINAFQKTFSQFGQVFFQPT